MNWKSGRVEEVEIQNSKVKSQKAFAWMVSRGGKAGQRAQLNEDLYHLYSSSLSLHPKL
jgi:hypothetical protein